MVLRGLDPKEFAHEDNMLIFMGIASHVASRRGVQTDNGEVFGKQKFYIGHTSRDIR